jgi:hypothetical protein
MRNLPVRLIAICLLSSVALAGCASRGSESLGKWVNTKNPTDTFQVTRNGGEYLIVGQDQTAGEGAIYKDPTLEVKGVAPIRESHLRQADRHHSGIGILRPDRVQEAEMTGPLNDLDLFLELPITAQAGVLCFVASVTGLFVALLVAPRRNCFFLRWHAETRFLALLISPVLLIIWPIIVYALLLRSRGIGPDDLDFGDD